MLNEKASTSSFSKEEEEDVILKGYEISFDKKEEEMKDSYSLTQSSNGSDFLVSYCQAENNSTRKRYSKDDSDSTSQSAYSASSGPSNALTPEERELATLVEKDIFFTGSKSMDLDYIYENASKTLREKIDKAHSSGPSSSGSAKNQKILRKSAVSAFNAFRKQIRRSLERNLLEQTDNTATTNTTTTDIDIATIKTDSSKNPDEIQELASTNPNTTASHDVMEVIDREQETLCEPLNISEKSMRMIYGIQFALPKKPLTTQNIKVRFKCGERVFAKWNERLKNSWYAGTVNNFKIVHKGEYGEIRHYKIHFDDGDIKQAVRENHILPEEDYQLQHLDPNFVLVGVEQVRDPGSNDAYARERGWFTTKLSGDQVFPSMASAMRHYDEMFVKQKGAKTVRNDLNFPKEWIFFSSSLGMAPEKKKTLSEEGISVPMSLGHDGPPKATLCLNDVQIELAWLVEEAAYIRRCDAKSARIDNPNINWTFVHTHASPQLKKILDQKKATKEWQQSQDKISCLVPTELWPIFEKLRHEKSDQLDSGHRRKETQHALPKKKNAARSTTKKRKNPSNQSVKPVKKGRKMKQQKDSTEASVRSICDDEKKAIIDVSIENMKRYELEMEEYARIRAERYEEDMKLQEAHKNRMNHYASKIREAWMKLGGNSSS